MWEGQNRKPIVFGLASDNSGDAITKATVGSFDFAQDDCA